MGGIRLLVDPAAAARYARDRVSSPDRPGLGLGIAIDEAAGRRFS